MITEEDNLCFEAEPTKEEVKAVIFQLNSESAGGPDGFTGVFYQACWEIIEEDVTNMMKAFFCGAELPRFITHTNLILIPKKDIVNTFSDMRPISLSNFVNKIFSRLIHERLVSKLTNNISLNQAGFIKNRSIVENILLTQEIISDIRLRTKDANVIMKLDMAKAYDRVSWIFLTKVLRKMGFSERSIDIIYRIVSNNWYSVLINGQQQGFFKSTRGVKQGDPLSPTLFILAAEVLSRSLNALHQNSQFKGFGMPKWSPKINHLAYADDMIIFTSADVVSLQKIMGILRNYEQTSGQKINMDKSAVYMHNRVSGDISITVEIVTGINRREFPFIYLGCPIYHCRRKKEFFNTLTLKIMNRLQGWKGKMLSFGGRAILIKHVLQSMPIHILSAINPPIGIIRQIHKMFAQFFWSNTIGSKSRHWVAWNKVCIPTIEGGLGFRSLHDVSLALFCKLWWNFRTKSTLWSDYMTNKYCRKEHAIVVQWKQGSQTWKKMLEARDLIEHQIWWQTRKGDSLFWFDNWTGLGALYYVNPRNTYDTRIQNVKEMTEQGRWNRRKLMEVLTEDIVDHIIDNISTPREERDCDRPCAINHNMGIMEETKWYQTWARKVNSSVIHLVLISIQRLVLYRNPSIRTIPIGWENLVHILEEGKARMKVKQVRWNFPPQGWCACNTDGASRGNPGRSAYGFCVRNAQGNLIYAQAGEIGYATNIEAEIVALLEALKYCKQQGLNNIIFQTDSQTIQNILTGDWKPPWIIADWIQQVEEYKRDLDVLFKHTLREANKLADALANYALDEGPMQCYLFKDLTVHMRRILNSDKSQIPYLRIKKF
ncbi:uncharacterized protein LOC129870195 [Solanum dulcamara]|uniref:uncharacterized protein LOC129870195 n=1 Tax=Solanum dulcamara TaxID=45834 RepID=UPI0024859091|nr:uncharacterized protein LOC129870195 [Solanum dulcamara]